MNINDFVSLNKNAFYTFDIGKLKKRLKSLRERLPENVSVCYAMKANPFVTGELAGDVERIEICSKGEAEICRALHIPKSEMVISGVTKEKEVIEKFISDSDFNGILTVESTHQYEMTALAAMNHGGKIKVLLRLTNDSQFGMDEETLDGIIARRDETPAIEMVGIQYFSGTQKTSVKKLRRETEHLDKYLIHLKEQYGFESKELEYGPGFPVNYFESDDTVEDTLLMSFSEMLDGMFSKPKITLELGRSIAASCGDYYTHIVDIKRNNGQNYLLVDGGMHQMVYYGQQMAMKRPFVDVVGRSMEERGKLWNICGSLCTMNDFIVKQLPLPDVRIGDVLCFHNTGAYCMTEGMSLFLSRDLPAIYLIAENGEISCARRNTETDTLNTPYYERTENNG